MTERRPLGALLREAGRELAGATPPPAVWAGLSAALEGSGPGPWRPAAARWRNVFAWSGAAACAAVLVGSVLLMLLPPANVPADLARRHGSGFVPLQPTEHWGDGPAWVVDAEMPAERLAALGLPYDPAHAGEPVRAELLLHASGEVLAVRFVR